MPAAHDILSTSNGDLLITGNDLQYGLSDQQHVEDTIDASPLSWKQFPSDGVGVRYYLNSAGKKQQLQRAIRQQLTIDGYSDISATITDDNGQLNITPYAERI